MAGSGGGVTAVKRRVGLRGGRRVCRLTKRRSGGGGRGGRRGKRGGAQEEEAEAEGAKKERAK